MSQLNGEELLTDMDAYISQSTSADAEAETALPFETLDEYNTDPLGFGDVTARLLDKVNTVFGLAVKYNRHSPDYLKSCAQLEKGIKYLGSSCLQKYALEQKKHFFPELGQLNTTNLYTMASIQFQKIDRALSEYIEEKHAVDDALLDMEFRYYHLMERIRSTEVKIRNYNEKRWHDREDYTPVIHGLAFSDKSWTKFLHEHDEAPAFQRARAFSENSVYNNVPAAQAAPSKDLSASADENGSGHLLPAADNKAGSQEPEVRNNDLRDVDTAPQTAVDEALSGQDKGLSLYGTADNETAASAGQDADSEVRSQEAEVRSNDLRSLTERSGHR